VTDNRRAADPYALLDVAASLADIVFDETAHAA
jgi:hypothetical protein